MGKLLFADKAKELERGMNEEAEKEAVKGSTPEKEKVGWRETSLQSGERWALWENCTISSNGFD